MTEGKVLTTHGDVVADNHILSVMMQISFLVLSILIGREHDNWGKWFAYPSFDQLFLPPV